MFKWSIICKSRIHYVIKLKLSIINRLYFDENQDQKKAEIQKEGIISLGVAIEKGRKVEFLVTVFTEHTQNEMDCRESNFKASLSQDRSVYPRNCWRACHSCF